MKIPFVDLKAQYESIKLQIDRAVSDVISDTAFIGGRGNRYVQQFEENFANYLGVKHCIGCANGTDSLEILLKSFAIGNGDEVLVPCNSWISTSEAVSAVGARPVFVDSHPIYYTIDITKIESKITSKTKAIIPVHLYGFPAEMDEIMVIAKKHKLIVIEDCAQSHGATYKGRKTGTIGDAGSFSFYPGKNLGAYGDAGCMVTGNEEIASKARMIANHGQLTKHDHLVEGRNSRLDGIQASILNVKLSYIEKWTEARRNNAEVYNLYLKANTEIQKPTESSYSRHVYHLYVIQIPDRHEVISRLKKAGIESAIHYPAALPFLKCYQHLQYRAQDFPVASGQMDRLLSLPMFPELTEQNIQEICSVLTRGF